MNLIIFLIFAVLICGFMRPHPTIYQISLKPWLLELSKRYGRSITKIKDIPSLELSNLKDLGVDYVWLMGMWKLGQQGLQFDREHSMETCKRLLPDCTADDIIGSPFAIVDYVICPDLGTANDLQDLKNKLNQIGLKLILDFVPNHSAVDGKQLTETVDLTMYVRAPKNVMPPQNREYYLESGVSYGGIDQESLWKDTAQWNYWNQKTIDYLLASLEQVAQFSDGMRCDMAMLILNDEIDRHWGSSLNSWGFVRPSKEFWSIAISKVKAKQPGYIFIAEAYWSIGKLLELGFDYTYDKELLDTEASQHLDNLRAKIKSNGDSKNYIHFVENHDEPRSVELFKQDYIANVAGLIAFSVPGSKFIFHGQLEGYGNKLDVHLRRAKTEAGSDYTRWFYKKILPIINDAPFHEGKWTYLEVFGGDQSWRLMAWSVSQNSKKYLIVINFSDTSAYGRVILNDVVGSGTISIKEIMSGEVYQRNAFEVRTSGLGVVVDKWNGQIFEYP